MANPFPCLYVGLSEPRFQLRNRALVKRALAREHGVQFGAFANGALCSVGCGED